MRKKTRPHIGITLTSAREGTTKFTKVRRNYVDSVVAAGGLPVLIPPLADGDLVESYIDSVDGLLLIGGDDVSPVMYNADPRPALGVTDLIRDRWEVGLLRTAEEKMVPVFGICRGLQLMNVARGGDLYQDIQRETGTLIGHAQPEDVMETLHHQISLDEGSLIREIFRLPELRVNSFHHQAVNRLGTGLTATARAADGIVEAIEDRSRPFYLGVQFHAEALPPLDSAYLRIFTAFVSAASRDGE